MESYSVVIEKGPNDNVERFFGFLKMEGMRWGNQRKRCVVGLPRKFLDLD